LIDINQELQNFMPIDLKLLEESEMEISDNVRNSIILYNKALENLRTNSEDIAIIELKRAISMNPHFHEAMNLLGICYGYIKEYAKAAEVFKRVVAEENNAVKALGYLNMIDASDMPEVTSPVRKRRVNENKTESQRDIGSTVSDYNPQPLKDNNVFEKNLKEDILKYVIGFVAASILFVILFFGFNVFRTNSGSSAENKTAGNPSSQYEEMYNKLNEDYKKLQKDLGTKDPDAEYNKSAVKLFEVEKLVSAKNYEEAADILTQLKPVGFKGAEKEKFDNLYNDAVPKAAWAAFNQGNDLLAQQKYQDAINKLSKIQVYGNDWAYLDITLYNIGLSYKGLNDNKNAQSIFQKIKEKYPSSVYAQYADYRLKEMPAN
jgi:tetratricopeptide (TPR) repeat protein